jgi:hypothetical protein
MITRTTIALAMVLSTFARAEDAPTTTPVGKFPGIEVDVKQKQLRIACQALRVEAPLEFFCVSAGTSEHESVLRTAAKPSHIHTALLMLGLEPGEPVKYSEAAKKWFPPHGPPLSISVEFEQDGKTVTLPANKLMRNIRTRQPMPATTWIFAGSRVMPDGVYAADVTGYIVSIVNFDLTLIDIPELASNSNETLTWEANLDLLPATGATVTMIIEPLAKTGGAPRVGPAPTTQLSDVAIDQQKVAALRARWERHVRPHSAALREAAQAQYEVIAALRREQQRLIDEADRIQRVIEELDKDFQEMITPTPEPAIDQ